MVTTASAWLGPIASIGSVPRLRPLSPDATNSSTAARHEMDHGLWQQDGTDAVDSVLVGRQTDSGAEPGEKAPTRNTVRKLSRGGVHFVESDRGPS